MGLKIKKSPKPASNQKNHSIASRAKINVVSPGQKKAHAVNRLQKNSSKKATAAVPSKKVVIPATLDTSKCELQKTQVRRFVLVYLKILIIRAHF